MNWKHEAIDKLRRYEAQKTAIENIQLDIERLQTAISTIHSSAADAVHVSRGESRREDMLLSNIVQREELVRALRQAKLWIETVERGLSILTEEEKTVLERFYIHPARGNLAKLCEELHLEQSSVYRLRDRALRQFTIALYGTPES